MVHIKWNGVMGFEATPPSGNRIILDAHADFGGQHLGPTPVEALMASLGACSAMDVISILEKKKQKVTGYRLEVDGVRAPEGEWPRPFLSFTVRHYVSGENIDPAAVARAVELSDEKYCSVAATLREKPKIHTEWAIEELSQLQSEGPAAVTL